MRRASDIASRVLLALVALAAIALVTYKLAAQIAVGPSWDSFSYLANAAQFAGRGFGYTEPGRPPLLSVITAVPLALGAMDERVIQVVDALLALFTLSGFYLLVRRRLSRAIAAGATLALLMAPPVWQWVGVGYTDLAAMGLALWALYFSVRATEDDARFYYAAFPTALAVVLMRVNAALFIVPFMVWLTLRARPFRDAKALVGGVLTALAALVPFAVYYDVTTGDAFYPIAASLRIQDAGTLADAMHDIHSFAGSINILAAPTALGALTIVVLGLALFGLADAVWRKIRSRRVSAARIFAALVVIGGGYYVGRHGFGASQAVVFVGVLAVWRLLAADKHESNAGVRWEVPAELALDAAMLAWLLSFFWFHETWAQKFSRYYITMAPSVVYLMVLGWRQLLRGVGAVVGSRESQSSPRLNYGLRALAWVPLVALVAAGLAVDAAATSWTPEASYMAARSSAAWIAARPDGATAEIYSDLWPITAWYLKRPVKAMPFFTQQAAIGHELDVNDAGYYVTLKSLTLERYGDAYQTGGVQVLTAKAQPPAMARVLYLGGGWDHYLEQIDGYRFALVHDGGDYDMTGSAYLDAYGPGQLARFHAIAAFGFLWNDRSAAEKRLQQWVANGGTLVLDASQNLQPPTSLGDSVLFDTVIKRDSLPRDARVTLDPTFASAHPQVGAMTATPFLTDSGAAWFGASYAALPGSTPLRVLASAAGRPVVAERKWGSGRVIWIGYNLVWHAFQTANASEARLVSAVLDDATGQPEHVASAPSLATSWIALRPEEPAANALDTSWIALSPQAPATPSLDTAWIALGSPAASPANGPAAPTTRLASARAGAPMSQSRLRTPARTTVQRPRRLVPGT